MKSKFIYGLMAAAIVPTAYSQIVVNELDSDTPGTDAAEFVELYDGGTGNTSLDGLVLVFFNGNGDTSYDAYDLNGLSTDANGFFVIGAVAGANLAFNGTGTTNKLQNGADAVALYTDDVANFPNGTAVTATNLVDAIVYGVNDGPDSGLTDILGGPQVEENENSNKDTESVQRNPDGAAAFIVAVSTPGSSNDQDPFLSISLDPSSISEGDGSAAITAEVTVLDPVVGNLTVNIAISDGTELAGPTSVTIQDGEDFATFDLDAVDDVVVDGIQNVDVTVSATGFQDGVATANVADDDLVLPEIVINEMQVKASGDDPQFVELYNDGATTVDLAGWSVKVFGSDSSRGDFGTELGSFTIPSGSPVDLTSGGFYLVGNAVFESVYGIVPDQQAEPDFNGFDITMILFDASDNAIFTVFSTDGNANNQVNNAGGAAVADITIGPDSGNSPAGFFLDVDGGTTASTLAFSTFPADLATPGGSNANLISRLRIEVDNTLLAEDAGTGAATATITRINETSGALTVNVASSDTSEVVFQSATVEFADGEDVQTVDLDVLDDSDIDGVQNVTLTASATGFVSGTESVAVTDDDAAIANLVINEMIIDSDGSDTEFLEIYNADSVTVDLAGYSIEKWDSDSGGSFGGADGGGPITIPTGSPVLLAPGEYYLMANPTFIAAYPSITPDLEIPNNSFENGSATIVLRDVNANVLHTVFATDGGATDIPNIDGTTIVPDATGNDLAFALLPDGDSNNVVEIDNSVPSTEATPGTTNGVPMTSYDVTISDCSATGGTFVINFTASGSSDVYVSSDLQNWGAATNGAGVASGTYTDTAPPAGKAFYLIQEAGSAAP